MDKVTIVNYGLGNLASIKNMIKKVGGRSSITDDVEEIAQAKKVILPGVGHFAHGMKLLHDLDLVEVLNKKALEEKVPVMGICLGMQLLTSHSEEGDVDGLDWIKGDTKKIVLEDHALKVPHMGWADVAYQQEHAILEGVQADPRYYFVHTYHVKCQDQKSVLGTTQYGKELTSAIVNNNVVGFQFHPEKSHKFGMQLIKNFVFNL